MLRQFRQSFDGDGKLQPISEHGTTLVLELEYRGWKDSSLRNTADGAQPGDFAVARYNGAGQSNWWIITYLTISYFRIHLVPLPQFNSILGPGWRHYR